MAGFIPRTILAFLWNPLSGATPFRKKKVLPWPPTLLGPLGVNKAQGALPLGSRAFPPPLSAPSFFPYYHLLPWVAAPCPLPSLLPFLAFLLPATLLRPLSVNKAQGALPLGRRALSPFVSPTYSLGSPRPAPCPRWFPCLHSSCLPPCSAPWA